LWGLRVRDGRESLARGGPRPLDELSAELFEVIPETTSAAEGLTAADRARALADLVALAGTIRDTDGTPLLSARYHLFTRPTDGAFTCLADQGPPAQFARPETWAT